MADQRDNFLDKDKLYNRVGFFSLKEGVEEKMQEIMSSMKSICCLFLQKNFMYKTGERKKVRGGIKAWEKRHFSTTELNARSTVTARSLLLFFRAAKSKKSLKRSGSLWQFFRNLKNLSENLQLCSFLLLRSFPI